jgi:hypothetical protein
VIWRLNVIQWRVADGFPVLDGGPARGATPTLSVTLIQRTPEIPMPRTRGYVELALVLLLAACGSDGPAGVGNGNNNAGGTFQVTVSGAITASFSGSATFVSLAGDNFGLALAGAVVGTSQQKLQFNGQNAGRPGVGAHTIGDGTSAGALLVLATVQGMGITSNSGTLTITASSSSALQGEATYQGTISSGGGTVTITATFSATCSIPSGCS